MSPALQIVRLAIICATIASAMWACAFTDAARYQPRACELRTAPMTPETKALALRVALPPDSLCPWCGAYTSRQCELEEEMGSCPWEDSEPDPDILRDDAHERERLRREFPDGE